MLRTPEQILSYIESVAADVTASTADLARAKAVIGQLALRCVEMIRARKERAERRERGHRMAATG